VKLGDPTKGVVAEENIRASIEDAVGWLRNKVCELYPDSKFTASTVLHICLRTFQGVRKRVPQDASVLRIISR